MSASLAPSVLPLRRATVALAFLPERRRLLITLSGAASGAELAEALRTALRTHPESATLDWVLDLRAHMGRLDLGALAAIASLLREAAQGRDERCLLVMVSPDAARAPWPEGCTALFRPRRCALVPDMDAAEAMLAAPAC